MSQNNMDQLTRSQQSVSVLPAFKHPAPLPVLPNPTNYPSWRQLPAAPVLRVKKTRHGDVLLEWIVPGCSRLSVAAIKCYQVFTCVLDPEKQPSSSDWTHVETIDALPLPMCCRFMFDRHQIHYCALRAVDIYDRYGPFSSPIMINLCQ